MRISYLSDLHLGNQESKIDEFRTALKKAEMVILGGDLIEGITTKDNRFSRKDNILSYAEQVNELIKLIKPYKKKILRYVSGNHENTLLSRMDIDTIELICTPLNIKSTDSEILNIDGINIFITHGSGSGTTYQGAVTKLINYSKDFTADYYFMSHTHKLFDMKIAHEPNPYIIVNTGCFLGTANYAKKRAYPNAICGYYILNTITKTLIRKVI